ncbi:MAG: response regulator [Proteobacteria bacterium]|nr:response regulator [Pseudomonadota bacterium]
MRIKLLLDLADEVWPVQLDSSDLADAIFNMSINAMHAMQDKESGAELTIGTVNQTLNTLDALMLGLKAGDYVQLTLTDTGIGMDAATREKIFDPFFSTKGEQGTGLGLSQVFGFIKRSGGTVKVYSEHGRGSKFVLYFPRYLGGDVDAAIESSEDVIDLRGKENILVVDDETALLNFTAELLGQQGYRVFRAENAKLALQILEREHIDLLLSDVIMPGMDGYQLAAIVQENYPAIKIQLASGFTETSNAGIFDESLHQNLIGKPYNSQALLKTIRALLNNKGVTAP